MEKLTEEEERKKIIELVQIIANFREIYNCRGRISKEDSRNEIDYLYKRYSQYKKLKYKYYYKIFLELREDILTSISDMRATLYL